MIIEVISMIELKNVSKYYYSKGVIATGFSKINVSFDIGEFVAITGESGSGKSTLLNVLSGLDTYEEGEMYIEGKETSHYLEKDWENYRRKYIGNIYQNFNLINSYTVYQNIDIILSLNGTPHKERKQKILELLKRVNMLKYKKTKVSKLSGGQKQRVAIARALAKDVPIIIADEPTGNLDKRSAESIIELLREISKEKLIIIVTHNYEQVEEYVTRKITMHDGSILSDKKITPIPKQDVSLEQYQYKNMNPLEKLRIGIRNTFNIPIKFLLLMAVYSFIVCALMGEYSFFKEGEYETSRMGYSSAFHADDHRIVFNQKDKSSFSKEELETIKNMKNIDYLNENDLTSDMNNEFTTVDEQTWVYGLLRPIKLLQKTNIEGKMPEKDNEILIEAEKDSYLFDENDSIIGKELYFFDPLGGGIDKTEKYIVTGIRYPSNEETYIDNCMIYVPDKVLEKVKFDTHRKYSEITIDFINEIVTSYPYDTYMKIETNPWVYPGTAFISEDENYRCEKDNCIGKEITIHVKNTYYNDSTTLKIEKTYNKKNIGYILDLPNYNKEDYEMQYNGVIFVNPEDYNRLFDKDTYQVSVYVKDITKIEETANKLEEAGYHTLMIKDTLVTDSYSRIVRVLKIIVTVILVVVLFFITYFIIKIILKSRNIYFSILRMLGASKKVCLDLLIIELLVVSNLSYFIFLFLAECNRRKAWNIGFINTVNQYFQTSDYMILYGIILFMSILISLRYSRKLFKDSVMNTYREEM